MEFLVYRSKALVAPDSDDCHAIVAAALRNNPRLGLTGFLHAENGIFVQYLEGPPQSLWSLYDILLADHRHRDLVLMHHAPLARRLFHGWRMGYAGPSVASFVDFLSEATNGRHPDTATAGETIAFLRGASQWVDLGLHRRSA